MPILSACSPPGTGLVVGDSYVQKVVDFGFSTDPGVPMHGFPGAAPCDYGYSAAMWNDWNTRPHPHTVVLAWTGNNLTSCMKVNGANAVGDDLVRLYLAELTRQAAWYHRAGSLVVIEGPPCHRPGWDDSGLALAAAERTIPYARYSDGERLALCPGGVYDLTLRDATDHPTQAGAQRLARALLKDAGAT